MRYILIIIDCIIFNFKQTDFLNAYSVTLCFKLYLKKFKIVILHNYIPFNTHIKISYYTQPFVASECHYQTQIDHQ